MAVLREVARRPTGLFGLVVVGGMSLLALFAPLIAPYDPSAQNIVDRLQGPSSDSPLRHGRARTRPALASDLRHPDRTRRRDPGGGRGARRRPDHRHRRRLPRGLRSTTSLDRCHGHGTGLPDRDPRTRAASPCSGPSLRNVIIVIVVSFAPNYARVSRAMRAVGEGEPLRGGRALARRRRRPHRRRPHPAEHRRAAVHPAGHGPPAAITIEAGLSFLGARRAAADALLGRHPRRRVRSRPGLAVGRHLPPGRADDHHARLHDARRDAARRRRPEAVARARGGGSARDASRS